MSVLYFIDEHHSDMFLTEDGKSGFVEDLIALLCLPHTEKYSIRKLAREYDVGKTTILCIVQRKTWINDE